ncbi:MAG: hypothetical protein ABW124_09675 [Candidatus Thiodiazotropha sp. 6PLUC9]
MSKQSDKPDDKALFVEELGDATPLKESRIAPLSASIATQAVESASG